MVGSIQSGTVCSLRSKGWVVVFCVGSFVFKSGFFRSSLSPSIALSRARPIPPANPKTVVPSEAYAHGGMAGDSPVS